MILQSLIVNLIKGVIMTIQAELIALVKIYATFDKENKCYVSRLDKSTLLKLDSDFIKLINQQLLCDGPEKENLKNNYKRLSRFFHPDLISSFLPEVTWLEQNLSEGHNDGICFKTLHSCYEKLDHPQNFKKINFADIKNREDYKKWLEKLKSEAGTYSSRCFYDSLIDLMDESGSFFDTVGQIKPKGLRTILTFIPVLLASFGAIMAAEELFSAYAVYFLILKGGQYLERSDYLEVKQLGRALQEISIVTATATTTLLVRLLEMTFWVSHQCYDASLLIGSSILKPILADYSNTSMANDVNQSSANLCTDLILASKNLSEGIQFKTPELKVISAPMESYLGLNAQQFFGDWRLGRTKRLEVEAFLFRMRVLDVSPDSLENKLITAQKELNNIKKNKAVYVKGGKTAEAVDNAEKAITLLIASDSASLQLVIYNKEEEATRGLAT